VRAPGANAKLDSSFRWNDEPEGSGWNDESASLREMALGAGVLPRDRSSSFVIPAKAGIQLLSFNARHSGESRNPVTLLLSFFFELKLPLLCSG
jgi:hypothetical protein